MEMLSAFSDANAGADARAFAALMAHLRAIDSVRRTVIMVQVENEIGMIPEARDHNAPANAAFRGGDEEAFMARRFAAYVERVAAAGKAEYALPMFVNAALPRPGRVAGAYPSGGPLPHLFDIWRAGAPSIDFMAPDIYFPNFSHWADRYHNARNPLFIPEAGRAGAAEAPADAFYAIGRHDALGFSPFAIDGIGDADRLGEAYAMLENLAPLILSHQGKGSMTGVRAPVSHDGVVDETAQRVELGDYVLTISFVDLWVARGEQNVAAHGGLIIGIAADEYIIAGAGITVTFATRIGDARAGIESIYEGRFVEGAWRAGRLLNGDESHQGRHVRLPPGGFSIQRVKLYTYQ
jgi:beta-galactosidase GanA